MPLAINAKKKIHRPQWESVSPVPAVNIAGSFVRSMTIPAYGLDFTAFCVNTTSAVWLYNMVNDSYLNLPTGAIGGTFGAGSCGRILPYGPSAVPVYVPSTTQMVFNLPLARDLRGNVVRTLGGPSANDSRIIAASTIGALAATTSATSQTIASSGTLTWTLAAGTAPFTVGSYVMMYNTGSAANFMIGQVTAFSGVTLTLNIVSSQGSGAAITTWTASILPLVTFTSAFTATPIAMATQVQFFTPRLWIFNPAATPGLGFYDWAGLGFYDWATNAWTTGKSVTNVSTGATLVFTTSDGLLKATNALDGDTIDWSGGNKSWNAATSTTLAVNNTGWTVANQWQNGYICIIGGLGAGQTRAISGSTVPAAGVATLTVAQAWTTNPDATSVWVLHQPFDLIGAAGIGGRGQVTAAGTSNVTTSASVTTAAGSATLTVNTAPGVAVPLGAQVVINNVVVGILTAYGTFTGANTGTCTVSQAIAITATAVTGSFVWANTATSPSATTVANSTALTINTAPSVTIPLGAAITVNGVFMGYLQAYGTFTGANTGTCTLSLPAASLQTAQALQAHWQTVTAATGTAWTPNQWAGWAQVRIVAGTGAGQVAVITQNTAGALVVANPNGPIGAPWFVNPDLTSVFAIEGRNDVLYLAGNAAVGVFQYSIPNNTWQTVAVTTARAAAPGAGLSYAWVTSINDGYVGTASKYANPDNIVNGRFFWSFRGGASAALDRLDLAWAAAGLSTWHSGLVYGNAGETLTTGACYEYDGANALYIQQPATALLTGRVLKFDFVRMALEPAGNINYQQGAATVGDKLFGTWVIDQGTSMWILYHWRATGQELLKQSFWQGYQTTYPIFP